MKKTILFALFVIQALFLQAQNQLFVSVQGNDASSGDKEHPFKTIERAVLEASKLKGATTIYIRGGVYRLEKPLSFTSADGGADKPLTLCGYPNEKATVSGGKLINADWKPYKKGILKTAVDTTFKKIDMLVVNGAIRHLARYPNYDSSAVRFNGTSADATSPKRVKGWKHPEGGFLHAMHAHDWGDFHYRITGRNGKGELALEGGWQNNRQSGLHPDNRMVEGIFEELDAPGEWFFDAKRSELFYYPLPDEDVEKAVFETPQVKHLVEVRGSDSSPVSRITFKDLVFTQTERTFMEKYEPLLRSDWTVYRGAALFFEGAERCTVSNCDLYNLGGNAVFFSCYNRGNVVEGSHFTQIGASAVCFVGDAKAVRTPNFEYNEYTDLPEIDRTPGPCSDNYPSRCVVRDNLIHAIGLFEKQITGVELSMCSNITVSHNSIYDTPRAGINVSEGTWGGHVIEFNDVFDNVKETGDHGSFNSWGRDRFWHPNRDAMNAVVASNPELVLLDAGSTVILHNNRFRCDRGWDIDLDDGSTNYFIYDNLCLNGGIKLREGFYRRVENNILINNTFHPHVWFENSGDVFSRNIVMASYKPIMVSSWGCEVDYNIFTDSMSYKNARAKGVDLHSVVASPKFRNPQVGDYRLTDDNDPVFRIGFHNFGMDDFGVQSSRLRSLARTPALPVPVVLGVKDDDSSYSWRGAVLKSLTTLGERSATGMDSERGVYVVSVDALGSPVRDYLRPNDVILQVNEKDVDTLKDFMEIAGKSQGALKLQLFRNQNVVSVTIP